MAHRVLAALPAHVRVLVDARLGLGLGADRQEAAVDGDVEVVLLEAECVGREDDFVVVVGDIDREVGITGAVGPVVSAEYPYRSPAMRSKRSSKSPKSVFGCIGTLHLQRRPLIRTTVTGHRWFAGPPVVSQQTV